ncbi:MAG: permease [Lactobacillales bacterium]|jgi:uncharacterized membrane protein YraQ (UPF0718 family)|nr:permease [Lactobacillales bacterium]
MFNFLPSSVLQMASIFLSIIIEALPFVLLGCVVSGLLHRYLDEETIEKILPKNKFLAVIVGTFVGFFFPSCECGIIPIVKRLLSKGVPEYVAFAFMLSAPIINPIVLFATFSAFSNSFRFMWLRFFGGIFVSLLVGIFLAYFNKEKVLKKIAEHDGDSCSCSCSCGHDHGRHSHGDHKHSVLKSASDEFFDSGKYLIVGSLLAAAMQTYLPTRIIEHFNTNLPLSIAVMMLLAFTLSLCSEADAFIGSSLLSLFNPAAVVAFLVIGPMVDIKNLLMMRASFRSKFILKLVTLIIFLAFIYSMIVGVL